MKEYSEEEKEILLEIIKILYPDLNKELEKIIKIIKKLSEDPKFLDLILKYQELKNEEKSIIEKLSKSLGEEKL